jgi:TetR/AcrR family transcriptional regulator
MAQKDNCTEQHIKETAKRIFFAEGKLHATTQDIADAAGVNRTLLNYYFRSRDSLFEQVEIEARQEMSAIMESVFAEKITLKEKLKKLIDVFIAQTMLFPYREMYIISEINRTDRSIPEAKKTRIKRFLEEIKAEMDLDLIKKMDPRQFCMNLFSLMAYPLVCSRLNKSLYNLSDDEFNLLMEERKQLIFDMIYQ